MVDMLDVFLVLFHVDCFSLLLKASVNLPSFGVSY